MVMTKEENKRLQDIEHRSIHCGWESEDLHWMQGKLIEARNEVEAAIKEIARLHKIMKGIIEECEAGNPYYRSNWSFIIELCNEALAEEAQS